MGPTWEMIVQKNVPARMRDGTTLMSDVYRPADDGEYPVLLTRLPYGKDLPRDPTYFDPVKAVRDGYIVVVQDVRGRYASEGEFVPFVSEALLIPLGREAELALGKHRIDEEDKGHLHLLVLKSEPYLRLRFRRHVLEHRPDLGPQGAVFDVFATRISGDAIQHANVLKEWLAELEESH